MSHTVTVELSDATYAALHDCARAVAQTPAELTTATLEQHFSTAEAGRVSVNPIRESDKQAARARFERHFGAVNLGYATGVDNEGIDDDLARAYADSHEEG